MDFARDDVQEELCALARRILETRVTADFLRTHAASGAAFDGLLWAQLHEAGLVTAALPTQAGGLGCGDGAGGGRFGGGMAALAAEAAPGSGESGDGDLLHDR